MPDRTIAILVYDGVRLMDATAPLEVFGTAARFGADYTTVLCSPDGEPVDAWPGCAWCRRRPPPTPPARTPSWCPAHRSCR
ncbi:hypothetical protein ACFQXA_07565 [Nocardiopsis composta]